VDVLAISRSVAEVPSITTDAGFWRQAKRNPERYQRCREELRRRLALEGAPDCHEALATSHSMRTSGVVHAPANVTLVGACSVMPRRETSRPAR